MTGVRASPDEIEHLELLKKLGMFLEKRYGIKMVDLIRLERGVFRLERETGKSWVVRIFPADRPVERAQGDAEILRVLEKNNFPAERCADSQPVTSPGGSAVLVTEFIEGAPAARSVPVLKELGTSLARLHSIRDASGLCEAGSLHHYSRKEGNPRGELDSAVSWLDEIGGRVPEAVRENYDSLCEQLRNADDCNGLPQALIHPDPVLKNVISTTAGKMIWIDWTGAGRGPRLFSLANFILSGSFNQSGWSAEFVDSIVEGYSSQVELDKDELERLPQVINNRPLVFAAFRLRYALLAGKTPNDREWWWPDKESNEAIAARAMAAFRERD